jgi:hypothetical protein
MNENEIIRNVLLTKFRETELEFNDVVHHLIYESRKWVEESLLFKLPYEVRRRNTNDWNPEKDHEWDSLIRGNYNLCPDTLKALLEIQPIDFWVFYLRMPIYEKSIKDLSSITDFKIFLSGFSDHQFPDIELSRFQTYVQEIFSNVKSENVIDQLKEKKIKLLLIEKVGSGRMQVNMMNILLFSMLHNRNHREITVLCIFMCYLMIYIEIGKDTDKESSEFSTIRHWNDNGNWGKIINYYLFLAIKENPNLNINNSLEDCLKFLISEDRIRLYPFEFFVENLQELKKFKNEKMRQQINHIRKEVNSKNLISISTSS